MGSVKKKSKASKSKNENARKAVNAKSKAAKAPAKPKAAARAVSKASAPASKKSAAPKTDAKKSKEKAAALAKAAAAKKAKEAARVKAEAAERKRIEEAKKKKAVATKEKSTAGKAKPAPAPVKVPVASKAPKAREPAVAPSSNQKSEVPASSPASALPAPAPKPTASNERTDVTNKKTEQPAISPVVATAAKPAISAPPTAPKVAAKATETKAAPKSATHRTGFRSNEFIVYPAHGVGQIIAIEEQEVAGFKLELFVINFVKDKMTLKVPLPKVLNGAIRKLAEPDTVKKALDTLTGRARIKRTMWSRRAQEYEAKINSGDLGSIAEVVRDLYRSDAQPEQSYSERQLYEAALDRMGREIAAVNKLEELEALKLIEGQLQRGPKRGAKTEIVIETIEVEGVIEQAA